MLLVRRWWFCACGCCSLCGVVVCWCVVAYRCSLCVVSCCRSQFVVCRWCCLPLAVADCCMSCTDCRVVANCGRARHCLRLYCIVFVCVLWMSCIM